MSIAYDQTFADLLTEHRLSITGDYTVRDEAERFVVRLQTDHPGVLEAWMKEHTVSFCVGALSSQLRNERAKTRRRAKSRAFHEGLEDGEISVFAAVYVVDEDNTRRTVADMTGTDHLFVADRYEATGKKARFLAGLHRRVAEKIGPMRTADAMTEEEYAAMLT